MRTPLARRAAVLAAAIIACGHAQKKGPTFTPVADADMGRLGPDQMAVVDAARSDLAASRDAVARARLRFQDAHHEEGYARADQTAAQADAQRAQAEMKAAQDAGDQGWIGRAQDMADAARLRQSAGDAHLAYAQKQVQAREAEVQAAEAAVNVSNAELERAKLTALQDAQIPAASKYDFAPFDRRVSDSRRAEEAARARAGQANQAAIAARDQWRALTQRWQARVQGSGGRG
jgi:colicin import membrane protein